MHLLDHCEGDVDVSQVLISVFIHFLAQSRVAATSVQDLECRLDVLGNDVLNSGVALIPVKWLLISKVTEVLLIRDEYCRS